MLFFNLLLFKYLCCFCIGFDIEKLVIYFNLIKYFVNYIVDNCVFVYCYVYFFFVLCLMLEMYLFLICYINNIVCYNEGVSCVNVNVYFGKILLLWYVNVIRFFKDVFY